MKDLLNSQPASEPDLAEARCAVINELMRAGSVQPDGEQPYLVKIDEGDLAFELRFNGQPLPLEGKEINVLVAADFQDFLDRSMEIVKDGQLDREISEALALPGPGEATAQVRPVRNVDASGGWGVG